MRATILVTLCAAALAFTPTTAFCQIAKPNPKQVEAKRLLDRAEISGGLVVHLGCGDGKLATALSKLPRIQVHALTRRDAAGKQPPFGDGAAGERLVGKSLPYIDNLVNLILVDEIQDVPEDELLRVLAPNGVALIKDGDEWKRLVKPRPKNIDDWTHYLHDSSGNAVAHDDVVGPPRHLQWLGSPRWSRHHDRMASMSAMVSADGRIFYIMDEGSRTSIQLPPKWKLIARDAFNGVVLWKQNIPEWHSHLWPLKSGPTQLARRLVAVGDTVYCTLGITAPVSIIDANTGTLLGELPDSKGAEEIIHDNGRTFVLANTGGTPLRSFSPLHNTGDQRRIREEFAWNELPRHVKAYDEDGKLLWSKTSKVAPLTLVALKDKVLFHDGAKVVCFDQESGELIWNTPEVKRRPSLTFNFGPKLVIHEDVVLFAGGDREMHSFSLKDGSKLWAAPHAQSGYQSPEDLLVAGGLVWSAPTTSGRDSGVFTGRDPKTGYVKNEFQPDVQTYWFHHRCYIAKATDKYLLTSRTGIEFIDTSSKHWDINHWVRGGCLYGVMPSNGLTYAPPHNCACYPEAKLFGMNVLAAESVTRKLPDAEPFDQRFEFGPAHGQPIAIADESAGDWPTFRNTNNRSGQTKTSALADELTVKFEAELGGRLSTMTAADGKLFIAGVDDHVLYARDANTGAAVWQYTTGGRIDSPPTIVDGQVLFGSTDGWVYLLRASDGQLIWRFRAAPIDRRLMAFEQLESVWPVHGSVLVEKGIAWFVAGRSNFLDGGLRLFRLDLAAAKVIGETVIDEVDPETRTNLQARLQTLQMPVGLSDILSTKDGSVYMRSQQFDQDGQRVGLGPHSGDAARQGSVQRGDQAHLFAPMGFLDDTYFHRAYWVYGRSFAGGHNGYYQAGKYAPSGRMLVFDDENVYGFGRKPEYLRWTTTIEHQLFSASKTAPEAPAPSAARRGAGAMVAFEKSASLNPKGKAVTVEAWVKAEKPVGVVIARGGPADGYAISLHGGKPRFSVRAANELTDINGPTKIVGEWTHLAGVLTADAELQLFVNGKQVASKKGTGLLSTDPLQSLEVGADDGSGVGEYKSPLALTGLVDEVRIYHGVLNADQIGQRFADPSTPVETDAELVLSCSFENGKALDASGNKNHGRPIAVTAIKGKVGTALKFGQKRKGGGNSQSGSFVKPNWAVDVPLYVRAMALANDRLVIAGPPDLINEEETFAELTNNAESIQPLLKAQDAALNGARGGVIQIVSTSTGKTIAKYETKSLPVWDGIITAYDRIYMSTTDGKIICLGE